MPLITKLTSPKNRKNNGKESIFKIGLTITFMSPSITHPIK